MVRMPHDERLGYHGAAVMIDRQRLFDEVQRVHRRYAIEVVEALGFCPWAKPAREAGRVKVLVSWDTTAVLAHALTLMEEIERDAERDVTLIAYPLLSLDRLPFAHFVAELRAADAARKPVGSTVLAMADFHPNVDADTSSPERLVPFVRSAPDPTIQLVRITALSSVRLSENSGTSFVDPSHLSFETLLHSQAAPPLSARVARSNLKTVESMGLPQVRAIVADIARDRAASYAALGVPPANWSAV
jgi:hypothetical protein